MSLTSIVMGILASEGKASAVGVVKSTTGDAIKRQYNERELQKKVELQLSKYCQGIQETLESKT